MSFFAQLRRRFRTTGLGSVALAVVPLTYETHVPPNGHGELDTPAVWQSPSGGTSLLFVTDKTENTIEIHDPVSNTYLGHLGTPGSGPGQLDRPNAVAVAYGVQSAAGLRDVLFVVERDNARVSMFALPYCNAFGSVGTPLQEPMGIALHWEGAQLQMWITDIGPSPQRVQVFDIVPGPAGLAGTLRRTFVMPSGAVLESIAIDAFTRTALVSDVNARNVMRYDLEGNLLGRFGDGRFTDDPEGIAIYDLGDGTGYVIVTDQVSEPMDFEVFDRQDFRWLTSFRGPTLGTDGVALVQRPMPNFPEGSFFAVHQDRAVHAYSWADIAAATGLCIDLPCAPVDAAPDTPVASLGWTAFSNPFRAGSTLRYSLGTGAAVDIAVFDVRGSRVAQLVDAPRAAGSHTFTWNGRGLDGRPLPAGTYILRSRSGSQQLTRKLVLLH
jgi:3-phytase